jgi:predicted MFS family arabinose efflux permease
MKLAGRARRDNPRVTSADGFCTEVLPCRQGAANYRHDDDRGPGCIRPAARGRAMIAEARIKSSGGPSPIGTDRAALRFVLLIGVVSLFADMAYEGARSITGPYLEILGASATVVGIVAGVGELLGYGLRLVSGRLSDRMRAYWPITIVGYVIQMAAVPALALAGNWPLAAALIIAERVGKAMRNPPRDAMLAQASQSIGRGWAFGIHEALDQTGALIGPLVCAVVLARTGHYPAAFAILLVPALLTLGALGLARLNYPQPPGAAARPADLRGEAMPASFWLYLVAAALVAAGFADFSLIAYHFQKTTLIDPALVPVFYSLAMGAGGAASLVFGRLYDRVGISLLIPLTAIGALFAPLAFLGSASVAFVGVLLWGAALGIHETIMAAAVADMVPSGRTASAYGIFTMAFGLSWFAGSAALGFVYDRSILATAVLALVLQLAAVPVLVAVTMRRQRGVPA